MREICQKTLPIAPWDKDVTARLPGIQPLKKNTLFLVDDAFNQQMQYRDQLIRKNRIKVFQLNITAQEAAKELLGLVLENLRDSRGYSIRGSKIIRPDRKVVSLKSDNDLIIAGSLVQEDLLILEWNKELREHVLVGGILCFPALWTLQEKMNKPMSRIHRPVEHYTEKVSKIVQRMFDNLQSGKALWRANWYLYNSPELFSPQKEQLSHTTRKSFFEGNFWVRVERQTLFKLPQSNSIVFGIHTFVVHRSHLSSEQILSLKKIHD